MHEGWLFTLGVSAAELASMTDWRKLALEGEHLEGLSSGACKGVA